MAWVVEGGGRDIGSGGGGRREGWGVGVGLSEDCWLGWTSPGGGSRFSGGFST